MKSKELFTNKEKNFDLKEHQLKIFNKIKEVKERMYIPNRIGLFLAPGAGKTFLSKKLAELLGYSAENILVVSPLSAVRDKVWHGVTNIHYEYVERFFGFHASFDIAFDLYLKANNIDKENLLLIIDEVHEIKNPATRSRQLIRRMIKQAKTTLLLTGTPGGRNDYEFFNISNLCYSPKDAEFLGSKRSPLFYDVTGEYNGMSLLPEILALDASNSHKRKKRGVDIVNIGNKRYVINDLETWYQRKIDPDTGNSLLDRFFLSVVNLYSPYAPAEYKNFKGDHKEKVLNFINKRMFVFGVGEEEVDFDYGNYKNHEILIEKYGEPLDVYEDAAAEMLKDGQLSRLNYEYCFCKIDAVLNIMKKNPKEQVIIWSSYVAEKNVLARSLAPYGVKIATRENVEEFKAGKIRGIIASSHADREAHTWTNCRINIYMNPNNSSVSFSQNRFRSNRIGQDKEVHYYFLYFEEERKTLKRMLASYQRNKNGLGDLA